MKDATHETHDQPSRHPGMTVVHVVQGLLRAQVIRAKLEDAGVPVWLDYESVGRVIGITVDGLGEVHVLVPTGYADEARALIEERTDYCGGDDVDGSEMDPDRDEPSAAGR